MIKLKIVQDNIATSSTYSKNTNKKTKQKNLQNIKLGIMLYL